MTSFRRRTPRPNGARPPDPFALVETVKNARRLVAVDETAADLGLEAGQALADALALEPRLATADADPVADLVALEALADWCERFSPAVMVDPPDGLMLDISGAGGLWGGETAMMDDLVARFARAEIPACGAVAETPGAAWALARFGVGATVVADQDTRAALTPLPVEALRLPEADSTGLRRLGVETVGEVMAMPRGELRRRLGPIVGLRLDQALGEAEEALTYRRAPAPFFERLALFEPVSAPESLEQIARDVIDKMAASLATAGRGGRRFRLAFHRVDGRAEAVEIGTARPSRDAQRLLKLFRPKLETVDPGFGVEAVTLAAERVEILGEIQGGLTEAPDPDALGDGPAALVDRLANRLGEDRVWRAVPHESWWPERAVARASPLDPPAEAAGWSADRPRPLRLFDRPEPIEASAPVPDDPPIQFQWRGQVHRVRRAEGPERLAREWWRAIDSDLKTEEVERLRDYYRVEDAEGRRYWIFRAGLFSPDRAPRWFLHGLFA